MMIPTDELEWAQHLFGASDLGDARRRSARLVNVASRMAKHMGRSLAKSCGPDQAALLGGYRLVRNGAVKPEAIRASGFAGTAKSVQEAKCLLAIEDTTCVSYGHAVATRLGLTGGKKAAKRNGFMVHPVLLLDAESGHTLGLIEQQHWQRDPASYGKNHTRKKRAYPGRESYKWQQASIEVAKRLGPAMPRTLSVCDRESDIYDYLWYKRSNGQRFVVRAQANRRLKNSEAKLFDALRQDATALCGYIVDIPQRGGRKARRAKVLLRSATFDFLVPEESLRVNVILAEEVGSPAGSEPLHWVLLTTEAIDDAEAALQIVRYYELRWRIEDYHKAWKSGVGVERQRFQSVGNLERMLAITAFLAVRLLQLRELLDVQGATSRAVLAEDEWKVLWLSTEPDKPLPEAAPPIRWAYYAIAKLGGFSDTKRTGRVGWDTLWHGWFRLQERLQGYRLSQAKL